MLHSIKELKKCAIHASDGEVGKIVDVYFDDESWVLRHLVVDTGNWLTRHEVLLSPMSVSGAEWERKRIHMNMQRDAIENSPNTQTHLPVSVQAEASMARHFGIPYYRSGGGGKQKFSDHQAETIEHDIAQGNPDDRHLRSFNEVGGYAIAATDDRLGHAADFLFDDEDWSIQYLVVDPTDLWPGKHVLVPASRIASVYWADHDILVDMSRDEIEHAQEYDPDHLPPSAAHQRIGAPIRGGVGGGVGGTTGAGISARSATSRPRI